MTKVLVSGAGVAGPAAASWLARAGYEVTVVERAAQLRTGGQNVDVRGSAREVLRRMGLEDAVREHTTGEVGTRFVDEHGGTVAQLAEGDTEGDGPTAELEVMRSDLARLVAEACPDEVTWRFGDHVAELVEHADEVEIGFAGGERERFDLVVVAEGVGSPTRTMVLPDEVELEPLGMYIAYGTIERTDADDDWWRFASMPGSRQVHLRPDPYGTISAMLSVLTEPGLARRPLAEQRAELRQRYADLGWEVPRILDGLDADADLYTEDLTRVKASAWSRGRVVLLGDAAWCVTPVGGGGSALALLGAYVLAAYLASGDDHRVAFEQYDAFMRPLVDQAQGMPKAALRAAAPRSRAGLALFRAGARLATSGPGTALFAKLGSGPESERELLPWPGTS